MSLADRVVKQSPVVRHSLALLLLLAAATIGWQGIILPIRELLTSQHRWRIHVRGDLALSRGQATDVPMLQSRLQALSAASVWQRFYSGDSANSGTAFREDITHYAALAGLTLRSIEPLPTTERLGLTRLGLTVSAVMTIGQLADFLTRLRSSPHYLRVDAIRVIAPQVQLRTGNHRLAVRLEIFGYERTMVGGGA